MQLGIATPDLGAMSQPAHIDPDVSATLSDFLTYTEHLPSAVVRSLSLIETLTYKRTQLQKQMHRLLTTYSTLPATSADEQPVPVDPVELRKQISHAYSKVEECARMSAAESVRIEEMVVKDANRLAFVRRKLNTLPMPPSRDPTPDAVLSSPQQKRKEQALQSAEKRAAHRTGTAPRVRSRKIMVPGEVLPPPNPDSPPPSEPSDWGSPAPVAAPTPSFRVPPASATTPAPTTATEERRRMKSAGPGRPKTPKPPKEKKEKIPKTPRVRPPGMPGTNAHSAVAGISTSNAIMALTKPPPDAAPGSAWLPWKRLTEYELAILRKRMKKNAAWKPSIAMRNRELMLLGRGILAMEEARQEAEATGKQFVNEGEDPWTDPTCTSVTGEQQAEMNAILGPEKEQTTADDALINRGMRLNEAKKLKRERLKAEEHAASQGLPRSSQKTTASASAAAAAAAAAADAAATTNTPAKPTVQSRKRKRGASPAPESTESGVADQSAPSRSATQPKKIKLNISVPPPDASTRAGASRTPKDAPAPSPNRATPLAAPSPRLPGRPPKSQRTSLAPESTQAAQTPAPSSTSKTRSGGPTITLKRNKKAASAEPAHTHQQRLRRGSNASLPGAATKTKSPPAPAAPAATSPDDASGARSTRRNGRRPVPGVATAEEDGRVKATVGTRKNKPKNNTGARGGVNGRGQAPAQSAKGGVDAAAGTAGAGAGAGDASEVIDPDEPRYCVCGDVSWGTMIACDNNDCEKEWFHLECVGLKEMPPRRTKWYCPDCRKRLRIGVESNGIVK